MIAVFRRMRIQHHLIIWFSLAFSLVFLGAGLVIHLLVEESIERQVREQLLHSNKAIVNTIETAATSSVNSYLRVTATKNLEIITDLDDQYRRGEQSLAEAQQEAMSILASQQIGRSGYIYVVEKGGRVLVHPSPSIRDSNMSRLWFLREQMRGRNGTYHYQWRNPEEKNFREKVVRVVYFEPWDWLIGVSGYSSELKSLLAEEDFRRGVERSAFGVSGHSFLFTGEGRLLFHSAGGQGEPEEVGFLKTSIDKRLRDRGNHLLAPEVFSLATPRGRLLTVVQVLPAYDWIVASSVNLDAELGPLQKVRSVILATFVAAFGLILLVSLYISGKITGPLEQLARNMASRVTGDLDIAADEEAVGEIGVLSRRFNHYVARLRNSRNKLHNEISVRIQIEQQLKLFAKVFENALEGITITDARGDIIVVNEAFTKITGYSREEVIGLNPRVLKSDRHPQEFYRDMWRSLEEKGCWVGEIWNRRKSGEAYPEILSINSIEDESGEVSHYVAVFHDITEMKLKEEQIWYQAYHDSLTGLPNRNLAHDRLEMAILHARRGGRKVGLFFLDLDHFKTVNDSLGHAFGDKLLRKVAERLTKIVREEDTVARLGGDEFLIIAADIVSDRQLVEMANRMIDRFEAPVQIDAQEVHVSFSIGITLFPDDGSDIASLTQNADAAMYRSKKNGRNGYSMFTPELIERAAERLEMEKELRYALKNDGFSVHYQPKICPASRRVTGLEALVRWQKRDGTMVSPADFIPLAEETGLIIPLGEIVLEKACRAMQHLDSLGFEPLKVAVNLSPVQFKQPNLVPRFLEILEHSGFPPERLELEITETTMMTDLRDCIAKLNILMDYGIDVTIDDFGTGYSSLYYLKNLPIHALKIDRSFIRDIPHDVSDAQIVETIIMMARNLGIRVVAEGVETREQLEILSRFRCGQVQGFFYSRPLPLEELDVYLNDMEGAGQVEFGS